MLLLTTLVFFIHTEIFNIVYIRNLVEGDRVFNSNSEKTDPKAKLQILFSLVSSVYKLQIKK